MWNGVDIAQVVLDGLVREDAALRLEQAVQGLDSRSEVELHASIAEAIAYAGFGVLREVAFPSLTPAQKKRPDLMRCDFVVTDRPGQVVRDALRERRESERRSATLFEAAAPPPPEGIDARECLWLEVKTVSQFTYTFGVPGPNRTYASELTGSVRRDVAKLAMDPLIEHGELLVVLFTARKEIAEHDLGVAANRALDKGVAIGAARWRHAEIQERVGNAVVTAAVFEVARE